MHHMPTPDMSGTFRLLDELAANAWPAPVQQRLEQWLLRSSGGVTRRASSVLTAGSMPRRSNWLAEVEAFYKRAGLPSRFQVSNGSPPELDPFLEEHGYTIEVPSTVRVAKAAEVVERSGYQSALLLTSSAKLTDEWLDAFMLVEGFPESKKAAYRAIYSAIALPACYACVSLDARTVGVGMAVTERGWSGIFSVATLPEHRRQGIAGRIMHHLARWSLSNNATDLYLQVVGSNENAVRLYTRLGFKELYGYHYRTKA